MAYDNPSYFLTAYGIAVKHGYTGSESEWLTSLSAYGMAVAMGYEGTEEEWLQKLNDPVPEFQIGEVVTLPGGTNATVSIGGTKDAPVLNFGIPRGVGMVDALPLSGGTLKGNVNMGSFALTGLREPTEETDAVPKSYADAIKLTADGALQTEGDTMKGNLIMAGFRVLELPEPLSNQEAVTKEYADRSVKRAGDSMEGFLSVLEPEKDSHAVNRGYLEAYVGSKYMTAQVALASADWTGEGPYTQTVSVPGILATDQPHYGVVYTAAWEAEKEAFALVDDLDTAENSLTFTCYEEKPEVNLTIQLEVNR